MIDRGCAVAVSMYSFDCIADRISARSSNVLPCKNRTEWHSYHEKASLGGPIKDRSSCMSLDSGMINMTCIVVPF